MGCFWFYGVTVAQEILVLLETVRVGLELLFWVSTYFLYLIYCTIACESSSTKTDRKSVGRERVC